MQRMKKLALKQFLLEFGRYFEPAHLFYHRRIEEGLTQLGFHVLSIEQLSTAPTWQLRLRATLDAQAQLIGGTYRPRNLNFGKTTKLLEGWLKAELRSLTRQLGSGIKCDKLVVVRHGACLEVRFVWPLGAPGRWRPPLSPDHPFRAPGMIQHWLKAHRN